MTSITARVYFPPSLRALLTSNAVVKLGYDVKQHLTNIATAFNDSDIHNAIKSNVVTLDLGQYAKLKGVVSDASSSLHVLAGSVLKNSFSPPIPPTSDSWGSSKYTKMLHDHIECVWKIYTALSAQDSVGLPLLPFQIQRDGQLVTLFQADKPVAEGFIVWPHGKSLDVQDDDEGHRRCINITMSRSLIQLTELRAPAILHALHKQSLEWIYNHGGLAVVTTSTLRTRSLTTPASIPSGIAFTAPVTPFPESDNSNESDPPFILSILSGSSNEEFSQIVDQDIDLDDADSDVGSDNEDTSEEEDNNNVTIQEAESNITVSDFNVLYN